MPILPTLMARGTGVGLDPLTGQVAHPTVGGRGAAITVGALLRIAFAHFFTLNLVSVSKLLMAL